MPDSYLTPHPPAGTLWQSGMSALHNAASAGNVEVMTALLAAKAPVDDRCTITEPSNYSLVTPLHMAVDSSRIQAVELLLDSGADIDAADASVRVQPTTVSCVA